VLRTAVRLTYEALELSNEAVAMKAFISYSHDSDEHAAWVEEFARRINSIGIRVIIDKWSLSFGQDINRFMESAIAEADLVFVICTPIYVAKSNSRKGGVGYESVIISTELISNQDSTKFIPIVRQLNARTPAIPSFMGNRLYANLSTGDGFGKDFALLKKRALELRDTFYKTYPDQRRSNDAAMRVILDGPHSLPAGHPIPGNIMDLMGVTNPGLVSIEAADLEQMFASDGFWYGSVTTEEPRTDFVSLTKHLALQLETATPGGISTFKCLCVSISAPKEKMRLSDSRNVMRFFAGHTADDASITYSSSYRQSGSQIAYAFN
jgi:hypothetical protein